MVSAGGVPREPAARPIARSHVEKRCLVNGGIALRNKRQLKQEVEGRSVSHAGATGDPESIQQTLPAAGEAVAEQIAECTPKGEFGVDARGVQEVVADKGYHSNEVVRTLAEAGVRSYISEPERGARKWEGRPEERAAVYANRRRIPGNRGKRSLAMRGQGVERNFAHQFDTGAWTGCGCVASSAYTRSC